MTLTITTNNRKHPPHTLGTAEHATNLKPFQLKAENGERLHSLFGRTYTHTDGTHYIASLGAIFKKN